MRKNKAQDFRINQLESESMMRRGELVRMANPSRVAKTSKDDGFPPGTGGCDCNHCLEGVTIPNATECCQSHLSWSLVNPWLTCADTDLTLEYEPNDKWITEAFTGPGDNTNEYRYELTIDVDGKSYLTLVLETDNDGGDVCLRYGRDGFDCLCDGQLTRKKPWGTFVGIEVSDTSCNVCLKPVQAVELAECAACDLPKTIYVTIDGITDDTGTGCNQVNGTYAVNFARQVGDICTWLSEDIAITDTCLGSGDGRFFVTLNIALDGSASVFVDIYGEDSTVFTPHETMSFSTDGAGCPDADIDLVTASRTLHSTCPPGGSQYGCENSGGTATAIIIPVLGQATSSGACDDDCTPTSAPVNPSGGCCFGEFCYDFWDESFCDDVGGDWYADIADCHSVCGGDGVCCDTNGGCFSTVQSACDSIGGTFHIGGTCDNCGVGACCRSGGTCELTTEVDCDGLYDTFYGVGSDCSGRECLGACCCDDTFCCVGQMTEDPCLHGSGTPGHPTSDCSGVLSWVAGDDCSHCPGSC